MGDPSPERIVAAPPAAISSDAGMPLRPPPVVDDGSDDAVIVKPHASPSVRKFARELGVNLGEVRASGPKQRIFLLSTSDAADE